MKSAPAAIFSVVFVRSDSMGLVNGDAVAPIVYWGGSLISSPERNCALSRSEAAIFTRPMPSRSFTFTASGWFPCFGSSPLMKTKCSMPSAAAPSTSACSAMRFRSRPVICTIGSTPASRAITAAGIAAIAAEAPVPGGGSASAFAGAMGAALAAMVARIASKKSNDEALRDYIAEMDNLRADFLRLVDDDSAAYAGVAEAMKLPRNTDAEKDARTEGVQSALLAESRVPRELARTSRRLLDACERGFAKAPPAAVSDIGVGAILSEAALEGAAMNVMINLASVKDRGQVKALSEDLDRAIEGAAAQRKRITDFVESRIAR